MTSFNHAPYKQTPDGRFVVWKNLRLGANGPSGPPFIVEDTEGEFKDYHGTLAYAKCYIAKRVQGLECYPWFGFLAKDGNISDHKVQLTARSEYKEIKGG